MQECGLLKQYERDVDAFEIINVPIKSKLKNFAELVKGNLIVVDCVFR